MSATDIAKGVREGWLVPDAEPGWYRFVWDFARGHDGRWMRAPARGIKRVRVVDP